MAARVKHATCRSLQWSWELDCECLPQEGGIEIVLDFCDNPVLLLRTTRVEIVPFDKISNEYSAAEGEGDLHSNSGARSTGSSLAESAS
ncbi:ASCH domain-containing protein [Paraburkholderia humisilvae]